MAPIIESTKTATKITNDHGRLDVITVQASPCWTR